MWWKYLLLTGLGLKDLQDYSNDVHNIRWVLARCWAMHDVQVFAVLCCKRSTAQDQVWNVVHWHNVENRSRLTVQMIDKAQHSCKHKATHSWKRFRPSQAWLLVRTDHNRGSNDVDFNATLSFLQSPLSKRLCESVSVRVRSYYLLLFVQNLLWIKFKNLLDKLFRVFAIWQIINFLLNHTLSIRVYVRCWNVGKDFHRFRLLRQVEHTHASEVVNVQRVK